MIRPILATTKGHASLRTELEEKGGWDEEGAECVAGSVRSTKSGKSLARAIQNNYSTELALLRLKYKKLEHEVEGMRREARSSIVPIDSFAATELESIKTILALVRQEDGVYVSSFVDANINGSGESILDAMEMLKHMIVDSFIFFEEHEQSLGDEPRRQLEVLREFVKRQ